VFLLSVSCLATPSTLEQHEILHYHFFYYNCLFQVFLWLDSLYTFLSITQPGDHPPITPVSLALPHELQSSDSARIYELVVRHFLATISPDAMFQVTSAKFSAPISKEDFLLFGKKELQAGFLNVYRSCVMQGQQSSVDEEEDRNDNTNTTLITRASKDKDTNYSNEDTSQLRGIVEVPELELGKGYRLVGVKSRQGATKPPGR
jgi:DNA topoisomerase IA